MSGGVSELEQFLQGQAGSGEADSEGSFTIDQEKALQKLSEHQLPEPLAWTLKVVQAAVLSESQDLHVSHTDTDVRFEFTPKTWAPPESQDLLLSPAPTESEAFNALRTAIWDAGMGQGRPFQLTLPKSESSFFWRGQELEKREVKADPRVQLTVSHRTLEQGKGLPILRSIQSVGRSAEIALFLKRRAHMAPLRLWVDQQRFDGVYHGLLARQQGSLDLSLSKPPKKRSHPILASSVDTSGPALPTVPGDRETPKFAGYKECEPLMRDFQLPQGDERQGALMILAANIGTSSADNEPQVAHLKSQLNWVKHGVVVQSETIPVNPYSIYLTLYICADHIPTDISGFALQQDAISGLRLRTLVACTSELAQAKPNLELSNATLRGVFKKLGYGCLVGGAALSTVALPAGIITFFAGAGLALGGHMGLNGLTSGLMHHHSQFSKDWAKKFPA